VDKGETIMGAYWLVVMENKSGEIKNVDLVYKSGALEDEIKDFYAEENPDVTVLMSGEGLGNRPEALEDLTYC